MKALYRTPAIRSTPATPERLHAMGTEHYLVNKKTKKLYLLGKGPWFELLDYRDVPKPGLWNLISLHHEIDYITRGWKFDDERPGALSRDAYLAELTRQIHAFISDAAPISIELLYNETEHYDRLGWPIAGTRYADNWKLKPLECCGTVETSGIHREHTFTCEKAKTEKLCRRLSDLD